MEAERAEAVELELAERRRRSSEVSRIMRLGGLGGSGPCRPGVGLGAHLVAGGRHGHRWIWWWLDQASGWNGRLMLVHHAWVNDSYSWSMMANQPLNKRVT